MSPCVWGQMPALLSRHRAARKCPSLADVDGDGRDELAVAVGPWRAYDVRVLQAAPDGGLELGARRRIGHVRALTTLRGVDGATLLAIAKDNDAPSKHAFSPDMPHGEPPGLYVVRRDGDALKSAMTAASCPRRSSTSSPTLSATSTTTPPTNCS